MRDAWSCDEIHPGWDGLNILTLRLILSGFRSLAPPTRSSQGRRVGAAPRGAYGRGVANFRRGGGRSERTACVSYARGAADRRGGGHEGLSVGCAGDGESEGDVDVVYSRAVLVH